MSLFDQLVNEALRSRAELTSLRPVVEKELLHHDILREMSEAGLLTGLTFIGMGVSGGEEGARYGPSVMVGGTEQSYLRVEKVLTAIAAKYKGESCCAWLGTDGAGHFVKTIHNGIEYADMEMISGA